MDDIPAAYIYSDMRYPTAKVKENKVADIPFFGLYFLSDGVLFGCSARHSNSTSGKDLLYKSRTICAFGARPAIAIGHTEEFLG